MKPGLIYGMQWDTMPVSGSLPGDSDRIASQTITVRIFDTSIQIPDDQTPELILLQPASAALELSVVDNDQSKFTQIRSMQARIRFKSDQAAGLDITTFADAYDNQYVVEIDGGIDAAIFHGFLMLPDGSMPFQPDPQVVELTASDHLPLLKDIKWVDADGNHPTGKFRIADIISQCLNQTGQSLSITVINNLRPGAGFFTTTSALIEGPNLMSVPLQFISFFYPGQQIVISDTVSNNGTFTVISVANLLGNTFLILDGPLTSESPATATITDAASTGHFYDVVYLDAKTFEQSIGVSEDCYTVLQKILGDDCCLFQYNGEWWIVRIDEYDNNPLYEATFDASGVLDHGPTETDLDFSIGFDQNVLFAGADQLLTYERPHKFVSEKFPYNNPIEIVCNIDFNRGTGDSPSDTTASETIDLQLDCWSFFREGSPSTGDNLDQTPEPGSIGVLRKFFEFGYEKSRYLVTRQTGGFRHYLKSTEFQVSAGDRLELSVDFRLDTSETVTNINPVHVRLIGFDGFFYDWDYDQPSNVSQWVQKTGSDIVFDTSFRYDWSGQDTTEWTTISGLSLKMPVDGLLVIRLLNGVDTDWQLWFSNLNIDYQPLLNGSYQKYSGHTNTVTRTDEGYAAKRENEVSIGDSPSPVIKGTMFTEDSGRYRIVEVFYPAAKYAITGAPDPSQIKPYGWHQAYAVWNQYKQAVRIISGSLQGLGNPWPGLLHRFTLTDTNANTVNRYFLLISFTQDWKTGSWNGTFVECFRTDLGKSYDDPHTFKYLPGG